VDEKSLKINDTETNGHISAAESTNGDADSITAANANPAAMAATPQPETPSQPLEEFKPANALQQQPVVVTAARRRFFNRIISRCVLQLLMIETVNELFSNDAVYAQIPSPELLRLMALLKKSFLFAKRFNADKDLRMRLWREGFMKQPPNLLKQESGSAATYVSILFRMFGDAAPEREGSKADVESALVPLCRDIIRGYTTLDEESQHRNIVAWRPVVVDVLEGYAAFPEAAFSAHIQSFYPLVVELLGKDLGQELRAALLLVLRKVGEVGLGIEGMSTAAAGSGDLGRRNSVLSVPSVRHSPSMDSLSDDPSRQFMGRT
jgi:brefeldin A-inhibited guanine nucleotide-exchange protein